MRSSRACCRPKYVARQPMHIHVHTYHTFTTLWRINSPIIAELCAVCLPATICLFGSPGSVQVIVEHDYTRGPWAPAGTYDAAWSMEFLEHVGRQYMRNYMATLKRAALIFVSGSNGGGWHHVEARYTPPPLLAILPILVCDI